MSCLHGACGSQLRCAQTSSRSKASSLRPHPAQTRPAFDHQLRVRSEAKRQRRSLCCIVLSSPPSPFHSYRRSQHRCSEQLPWRLSGKASPCQGRRHRFNAWARKVPWRKKRQPTPVFLPGKSHGRRSLAGCSPRGCERDRQDLATQQNNNSKSKLWETLDG